MFRTPSTKILAGFAATAATCLGLLSIAAPASADVKPESGSSSSRQQYEPPGPPEPPVAGRDLSRLDTSSVAFGALGGIALGGAGLGISLGVHRRRDQHVGTEHS